MKRVKYNEILVSDIFEYLGQRYYGEEFNITQPSVASNATEGSLVFVPDNCEASLNVSRKVLCVAKHEVSGRVTVVCNEPEVAFYRIINEFFMDEIVPYQANSATVSAKAVIGRNVTVSENAFIGENVRIGNKCHIGRNVIIDGNTIIGNGCRIESNSVIGLDPYDFIMYEGGYLNKPGFGKIVLEDNVLIGTGVTIEQPKFGVTTIRRNVKIDGMVNIGSGCKIASDVQISAGCVLCRDVDICCKTIIGVNVSIRENIGVCENTVIGMGSVVVKSITEAGIYAGNPAKMLKAGVQ